MAETQTLPSIYKSLCYINVAACIVATCVPVFMLFTAIGEPFTTKLTLAAGFAILDCLGTLLLLKFHSPGLWLSVIGATVYACLLSSINIAFIVLAILAIGVLLYYYLPSMKPVRDAMILGLDMKRSKRLYSFSLLYVFLVGVLAFVSKYANLNIPDFSTPTDTVSVKSKPICRDINSPDITFNDIIALDKSSTVDSTFTTRERKRALKHLFINEFMTEYHDCDNLRNIILIYKGFFSPQQQDILDWYSSLPNNQQELWLKCPKIYSLSEFKTTLDSLINKKQL